MDNKTKTPAADRFAEIYPEMMNLFITAHTVMEQDYDCEATDNAFVESMARIRFSLDGLVKEVGLCESHAAEIEALGQLMIGLIMKRRGLGNCAIGGEFKGEHKHYEFNRIDIIKRLIAAVMPEDAKVSTHIGKIDNEARH